MKDAATCEKPRIGGNSHRPGGVRMGQPIMSNVMILLTEYIGQGEQTEGTETSKYLQENKAKRFP